MNMMDKKELYNKIMDKVSKEVKKALNENTNLLNFDKSPVFDKSNIDSALITKNAIKDKVISDLTSEISSKYGFDRDWVESNVDGTIDSGIDLLPYAYIEQCPRIIDGDLSQVQYALLDQWGRIYLYTNESLNMRIAELLIGKRLLENGIDIEVLAYEELSDINKDLKILQNLLNIKTTYCWTKIGPDNLSIPSQSEIKTTIGIKYY